MNFVKLTSGIIGFLRGFGSCGRVRRFKVSGLRLLGQEAEDWSFRVSGFGVLRFRGSGVWGLGG